MIYYIYKDEDKGSPLCDGRGDPFVFFNELLAIAYCRKSGIDLDSVEIAEVD